MIFHKPSHLLSPNVHWAVSDRVNPDRNTRVTCHEIHVLYTLPSHTHRQTLTAKPSPPMIVCFSTVTPTISLSSDTTGMGRAEGGWKVGREWVGGMARELLIVFITGIPI